MRTIPVLTVAAIGIAIASTGTAYYFLRDNASSERAEAAKPSVSSISNLEVQDTPIRDGRGDQTVNPEQPRLTLLQEKVAELEARLRYMETAASEQTKDQAVSRPNTPVSNNGAKKAKTQTFSESDFSHCMDKALDAGSFDRDATELAMDQAITSLAKVQGINLADMQCGDRFCRATLIRENGKPLNISQLIGEPPFTGAGFTIDEPDGRVRVYVTQPGQSLSALRSEAEEVALGDTYPE